MPGRLASEVIHVTARGSGSCLAHVGEEPHRSQAVPFRCCAQAGHRDAPRVAPEASRA
jgi:hypothetical protein